MFLPSIPDYSFNPPISREIPPRAVVIANPVPAVGILASFRTLRVLSRKSLFASSVFKSRVPIRPSPPQGHHRMQRPQQNQGQRKRNMHEQPAMQPAMQSLLLQELPRLVANVLQIGKRSLRGYRQ